MNIPGFSAHAALYRTRYVYAASSASSAGEAAPLGRIELAACCGVGECSSQGCGSDPGVCANHELCCRTKTDESCYDPAATGHTACCCSSGWIVQDGTHCGCGPACEADQMCCDGSCTDLQNDPHHCGSCGGQCSRWQTCSQGHCCYTEGAIALISLIICIATFGAGCDTIFEQLMQNLPVCPT